MIFDVYKFIKYPRRGIIIYLSIYKFIMHDEANLTCTIPFLDCRGYYDLAAEIIGLVLAGVTLYRAMANFRELRYQRSNSNDTEYQLSLRRKIRVNLLNTVFVSIFIVHIAYSMILFQIANEQTPAEITQNQLEKWYRCSQVLMVELLNVLVLLVGWLYWKGLNFFYRVKQLDTPLAFRDQFRYVILLVALYCLAVFIINAIMIFRNPDEDQFTGNLLVLLSSIVSVAIFLFFRLTYYANIFRSVKLGSRVITREKIYNMLVILSSMARVALCVLGMSGVDLQQMRNYNSDCHDTSAFHGIVLLSITIGVDLLPSFIFTRIFTSFERQRHLHADVQQTLFSLQPSEMESGTSGD